MLTELFLDDEVEKGQSEIGGETKWHVTYGLIQAGLRESQSIRSCSKRVYRVR